jgi:hypothetical protein
VAPGPPTSSTCSGRTVTFTVDESTERVLLPLAGHLGLHARFCGVNWSEDGRIKL